MKKSKLEKYMFEYIENSCINTEMKDMFIYAIKSGGKRFRPMLFLSLFDEDEASKYLNIATSIEFTHNYSLIHDDLPAMDNDLFRRGKKSLWNKYGADNAILIGDCLITEAINLISTSSLKDGLKVSLINELIKRSGTNGMVLGQFLDVNNISSTKEELDFLYRKKTGEMIGLCFSMFAIIKNLDHEKYYLLGENLGLLFQYQDDILEQSNDEIEKNDSDQKNNKNTFNTIINNKDDIEKLKNVLYSASRDLNFNKSTFDLFNAIVEREKNE